MKFSYRFSNLLGAVYRRGNLTFTQDGDMIISPVGNRISLFDLKNNKSETLPVESTCNITAVTLSPDGSLMIAVNEEGEAVLVSMKSRSVLHYYHFHRQVHCISFSPDGSKFAVTKENLVLVFHAPGKTKEFNPFVLFRTYYGAYDETVSIDWTTDSSVFCVGSKDMNTRVFGVKQFKNLRIYSLGGHTNSIVNSYFEDNSLDLYTLSTNGQLCVFECDTELDGLIPSHRKNEKLVKDKAGSESEGEDDNEKSDRISDDDDREYSQKFTDDENMNSGENKGKKKTQEKYPKILYKRIGKYTFTEARTAGTRFATITSAAFHKKTHILCTGFSDGAFFLHEMPEFNLIHSLSISDQMISSIVFNRTGDWIGLGCAGIGQLLVWEWQSESYVLKQQGHFNNMACLAYSPDAQYIVTGGDDSKVKVWNTGTGFCFVTFSEHNGGITGVVFTQSGQVIISSSLDGTVRAFDLNRYRNFRTFTSPRPVQFSCLAVDPSGEIVCAGGRDTFEIFVWSMQTGRLLEILSGHEAPISSLSFSPNAAVLASGSWDKTVKLWDVFDNKGSKESLSVLSDVLAVMFRPDGKQLAIACLNAQISFWDVATVSQMYSIEGRHDIGYSRSETDKITAKKSAAGKAFNTLCYSADGRCILAAGKSKNVCIYSIVEQILLKKFEITCNTSLDGTVEFLDRRKMTEFGSMALVEEDQDSVAGKQISLPGVRTGDMSRRSWKPEVRVSGIRFSPTGRSWAATTNEGLLIYSLDQNLVFDPFDLEMEITPENVRKTLEEEEFSTALMLAFRLNEQALILRVVENIPINEIHHICQNLADVYVDKLLSFISAQLESSHHIEFYLKWTQTLLYLHGPHLKKRSQQIMSTLRNFQKNLTRKNQDLSKICDFNKYSIEYILSQSKHKNKQQEEEDSEQSEEDYAERDSDSGSDNEWTQIKESHKLNTSLGSDDTS